MINTEIPKKEKIMFAPVRVRFLLKQIFGIIWWGGPVRNAVIMHHFAVLYVSMYEDTV